MLKKLLIGIAIGMGAMAGAHAQDYSNFMGVDVNSAVADSSAAAAYYDQTGVVTSGINDISLIGQADQQVADYEVVADAAADIYEDVHPLIDAIGESWQDIQEAWEQLEPEIEPFLVDTPDQPDPGIAAEC